MNNYDKSKSCKDCPDRYVGCHSTCEFYINRTKERNELRNKIQQERSIENTLRNHPKVRRRR